MAKNTGVPYKALDGPDKYVASPYRLLPMNITYPMNISHPVVDEIIQPTDVEKLESTKRHIIKWLQAGEAAIFQAVDYIKVIALQHLYAFDLNPDTGNPFTSMSEYYPYLVAELKAHSNLHKLSERLLREVVALDKVFVQQLGIPREQILRDGISIYSEVREALDYDARTGEIHDNPRPGKIGKEEALQILQSAKESEWALNDVRAELDERRGVSRRRAHIVWSGSPWRGYMLQGVQVWEGDEVSVDTRTGYVPYEIAQWLTKKLGATTNLSREGWIE